MSTHPKSLTPGPGLRHRGPPRAMLHPFLGVFPEDFWAARLTVRRLPALGGQADR